MFVTGVGWKKDNAEMKYCPEHHNRRSSFSACREQSGSILLVVAIKAPTKIGLFRVYYHSALAAARLKD